MAVHRFEGSLAAATTIANLLTGSRFEQLPFPATVLVYAVQDTADAGSVILELSVGNSLEIDNAAVPTFTANLGPNRTDHFLGSAIARAHDRIICKLINNDAVNASAYRVLIEIRPL